MVSEGPLNPINTNYTPEIIFWEPQKYVLTSFRVENRKQLYSFLRQRFPYWDRHLRSKIVGVSVERVSQNIYDVFIETEDRRGIRALRILAEGPISSVDLKQTLDNIVKEAFKEYVEEEKILEKVDIHKYPISFEY